ncbi:MAG TPA: MGMT family protein [Pyrinomonadaceae bacterium]|nr:MGMT family protein [Pyrinomonadaceae bacterium]
MKSRKVRKKSSRGVDSKYREKVFKLVRKIPRGRVMTYGQIALILGAGYTPRTVGFVMHSAGLEDVPWQRVINSAGKCSTGKLTIPINLQQKMLESEGIEFDTKGKCNLDKYLWHPMENKRKRKG